jgi:xanthine/uracil permease
MSKQGQEKPASFLRRLLNFLTPVVRICLLVGMVIGCLLGLYLGLGVPPDGAENVEIIRMNPRNIIAIVVAMTVAGMVFGTIIGVVVENIFREKTVRDQRSSRWWRKKSPRVRH